ncbi:unnamed protein product [Didymodactylos carnosus]|uniref:Uncharacterized protein n=1 Tax=Didymodactylos carnosus TaxID=1234261 RepID=A0A814GEV6_9BILA|nr:unnamed protein product [Didymodactylos carnosus]CAF0995426.1 unnamed protein product [Didymodactylos carnosus]CAF3753859.1 unnamed protein product [Didymodactylos carnosus]CAF3767111.1 unnamed protein product [Didymodactylos carnosus]
MQQSPCVPTLTSSKWWLERGSHRTWTQWFMRFTYEMGWYSLYTNYPRQESFAINHCGSGLSFNITARFIPNCSLIGKVIPSIHYNFSRDLHIFDFHFNQIDKPKILQYRQYIWHTAHFHNQCHTISHPPKRKVHNDEEDAEKYIPSSQLTSTNPKTHVEKGEPLQIHRQGQQTTHWYLNSIRRYNRSYGGPLAFTKFKTGLNQVHIDNVIPVHESGEQSLKVQQPSESTITSHQYSVHQQQQQQQDCESCKKLMIQQQLELNRLELKFERVENRMKLRRKLELERLRSENNIMKQIIRLLVPSASLYDEKLDRKLVETLQYRPKRNNTEQEVPSLIRIHYPTSGQLVLVKQQQYIYGTAMGGANCPSTIYGILLNTSQIELVTTFNETTERAAPLDGLIQNSESSVRRYV